MNPVEDRVIRALRARAEEADMSQSTLNRNHTELMRRVREQRASRLRLLVAAAAAVVLVAAGAIGLWVALDRGSGTTSEAVPAASDAATDRAAALVGGGFSEFKRTVTTAELKAAGVDDPAAASGGARLNIVGDRMSVLFDSGQKGFLTVAVLENGAWRIDAQNQNRGNLDCQAPGTYSASLTGNVLTMRAVDDPCPVRRSTLEGAWTR